MKNVQSEKPMSKGIPKTWARQLLLLIFLCSASQIYAETIIYTVKEGDTLKGIAKHYNISVSSLVKINRFRNDEDAQDNIIQGESILIPKPEIILASVNNEGINALLPGKIEDDIKSNIVLSQAPKNTIDSQTDSYTVQRGDNISSLAVRFNSSSAAIRKANALSSDQIRIGQKLKIPKEVQREVQREIQIAQKEAPTIKLNAERGKEYTVEKGDTLLGISRKTKTSIGVIRALNQLDDNYIRPGQTLRISSYEKAVQAIAAQDKQPAITLQNEENSQNNQGNQEKSKYKIQEGDTLSSISRKFDISIPQLKQWNQLNDLDFLKVGQTLYTSPHNSHYTIAEGDTLWSISQHLGISVEQLQAWNPSLDTVLHPKQTLVLAYQNSRPQGELPEQNSKKSIKNDAEKAPKKGRPIKLKSYFTRYAPRVERQPNATYYEEFTDDPLENYQTARKLLAKFESKVAAMPKLGKSLKGYHILIDPGHGGLDPGFNSQSEDGSGNPLYIIEDEYNYDYALRLFRLLKRHGAEVGLTIISPNQLIVNSPDASRTLVSQKNEVYNSPFINQRGEYSSWPVGTPVGLHKRVEVAESFFNGTPKNKRIFISLHNDNSPWDKDGRLVLFYNDSLTIDHLGEQFAKHMVPFLGKHAHMRGQNLAVLRKNPAKYSVLVELRNIAYSRNSWAIRNADLRQEDIEMLGNGIINFVESL